MADLTSPAPTTTAAASGAALPGTSTQVASPSCAGCGSPPSAPDAACAVCLKTASSYDRSLCGLQQSTVFSFDGHVSADAPGPTTILYDLGVCLITKPMRQKMNRLISRPAYPFLLANPPCNADLAATAPLSHGVTQPGAQATASAEPRPSSSSSSTPVISSGAGAVPNCKVPGAAGSLRLSAGTTRGDGGNGAV